MRHLKTLTAFCLAALGHNVSAATFSADTQVDQLKSGATWQVSGISASGDIPGVAGLRGNLRAEEEHRSSQGTTSRASAAVSYKLTADTALSVGATKGFGAGYGLSSAEEIGLYTAIMGTEVYVGYTHTGYADSSSNSLSTEFRIPIVRDWTLVAGGATSQAYGHTAGHYVKLGTEYHSGAWTWSVTGYQGQEEREAAQPWLGTLSSQTLIGGFAYQATDAVSLSLKLGHVNAGTLSRDSVYGSVNIAY